MNLRRELGSGTASADCSTKPARSRIALFTVAAWTGVVVALGAAELKPQTIEAFDRYVRVTEARMQTELDGQSPFLWVDQLSDDDRDEAYAELRAGEVVIDRLETRDGDEEIKIPDGKIHHWIGDGADSRCHARADHGPGSGLRPIRGDLQSRRSPVEASEPRRVSVPGVSPAVQEEGGHRRAQHRVRRGVRTPR